MAQKDDNARDEERPSAADPFQMDNQTILFLWSIYAPILSAPPPMEGREAVISPGYLSSLELGRRETVRKQSFPHITPDSHMVMVMVI